MLFHIQHVEDGLLAKGYKSHLKVDSNNQGGKVHSSLPKKPEFLLKDTKPEKKGKEQYKNWLAVHLRRKAPWKE